MLWVKFKEENIWHGPYLDENYFKTKTFARIGAQYGKSTREVWWGKREPEILVRVYAPGGKKIYDQYVEELAPYEYISIRKRRRPITPGISPLQEAERILGVKYNMPEDEIIKKYHNLVFLNHPDRFPEYLKSQQHEKTIEIMNAFSTILSERKKKGFSFFY